MFCEPSFDAPMAKKNLSKMIRNEENMMSVG
jgi:hypothetical protein